MADFILDSSTVRGKENFGFNLSPVAVHSVNDHPRIYWDSLEIGDVKIEKSFKAKDGHHLAADSEEDAGAILSHFYINRIIDGDRFDISVHVKLSIDNSAKLTLLRDGVNAQKITDVIKIKFGKDNTSQEEKREKKWAKVMNLDGLEFLVDQQSRVTTNVLDKGKEANIYMELQFTNLRCLKDQIECTFDVADQQGFLVISNTSE